MFTFVEAPLFTKRVGDLLSDREYASLQAALSDNPELGAVIRGSGGIRKVRWGAKTRGKRGGVRVIYYVRFTPGVIWMLTLYAKGVAESIPLHILRKIRREIEDA